MKSFPLKCMLACIMSITLNVLMAQGLSSSLPLKANIYDVLLKDSLKVLDIGNSYTTDATTMLPLIVKESKINVDDMCLYITSRGGGSFHTWLNCLHDKDGAKYSISKVLGGITANVTIGVGDSLDGSLFRKLLSDEQWDIILLHPVSDVAPYYERWTQDNSSGHLDELLEEIRQYQPQAVIGFLLVHSYWGGYSSNKEHSALERWRLIATSIEQLTKDYDIKFVIPYGTAVQNLRASSYNNEYDLTRDGTHLGYGLARYAAACCYFQSLIYPRSGVSVIGNAARYDASKVNPDYHSSISVDDTNAYIAQLAADLATKHPYECINPEEVASVVGVPSSDRQESIFSIQGIPMDGLRKGLNIVRTAQGTVRKEMRR